MELKTETNMSYAQKAYELLKEDIISQRINPGSLIVESDYADKFGMSRTPVREALKRLSNEGLIDIISRKGAIVKSFTIDDLIMCHEAAEGIEGILVYSLARKFSKGDLSTESINELVELTEQMDRCMENGDMRNWTSFDTEFHNKLIDLCDNPYLVPFARQIRVQLNRALWFLTPKYVDKYKSNMEHKEIIKAIQSGDLSRAKIAGESHTRRIKEELQQIMYP